MKTNFYKNCPSCNKYVFYKDRWSLTESISKNRKCRSCSKIGHPSTIHKNGKVPKKTLQKMRKSWFKKGQRPKNADFRKGKTLEEIYGKEKSKELKIMMSNRVMSFQSNKKRSISCIKAGCGYGNKGRKTSNRLKRLFRKQMVERLLKTHTNFHPSYNVNACKYFDQLNKKNECNIQHALNGGEYFIKELSYWLDGYDKENNIVYEWDERRHFNKDGTLKDKDVLRENEIKNFLNCKIIRIKDPKINFYGKV